MTKIMEYTAAWHPDQNIGFFHIIYEDNTASNWQEKDPMKFMALLTVLQGEESAFLDQNGWITTGEIDT